MIYGSFHIHKWKRIPKNLWSNYNIVKQVDICFVRKTLKIILNQDCRYIAQKPN